MKLTDRQKTVLKAVEEGLCIPFKYKNERDRDCFIDIQKEPSLLGNLYFTITVRSLFSKGLLCDSSIETQCKAKCLISGIKAIKILHGFKLTLTPLGIEILKGDL